MATWLEVAAEFRGAAWELWRQGLFRASLGRSYYAAYAELTHSLASAGATWATGREGPGHESLTEGFVVENHLGRVLSAADRTMVTYVVKQLYRLRLMADYQPSIEIREFDARNGLGHLKRLTDILEKTR